MTRLKDFLGFGTPPGRESRGRVLRLEQPALREFPALSDYKIIFPSRWGRWQGAYRWLIVLGLLLPTVVSTFYFGLIATPRYVAEAKFIVRTAAKASGGLSLTSLFQITGLSRAQDDVFSVLDFMTSRDAVTQLMERLPLENMYGLEGADFVARFPSIFFGSTREQFYKYFQWMISVSYSNNSGVSTLQVQAFRPEDARNIADAMLSLGEGLVNKMNERIYQDAVKVSLDQVTLNEKRLIGAQITLTDFRNRELMIDPASSSAVISNVVQRLSNSLAETQTELNEMKASSPLNPQIASIQRRADALIGQIASERTRISSSSDGLANKTSDFERLSLEREFAKQSLTTSNSALEAARAEAMRKQLYLERVVEPNLPDYAAAPASLRWIATTLGANLLTILIVWLFFTGIREHGAAI
jgi:capsular polysaccharide transport system permease protein